MFAVPVSEAARQAAVAEIDIAATDAEALDALASLARSVFKATVAAVTLIGADTAHVLAPAEFAGHTVPRTSVPCAETILQTGVMVVADLAADSRFQALPTVAGDPHFRFYAGVPLARRDGLNLGTFCLFDTTPRTLTLEQESQLRDFGRTATSLLRLQSINQTLVQAGERLRTVASTDALTGCLNRIGLREQIGDLFDRALGQAGGAAVIYVDIDHFKQTNDRFGHPAGDMVLCAAARRLHAVVRDGDLVGRIGGDEFCVVLRSVSTLAEVEQVAARIVAAFREPVVHEGCVIPCTVSVGAAFAPLHASSREGIAKAADAALYRAKAAGRAGYALAS